MKYKVGQTITIKKDLDKIENFCYGYSPSMKKYEGTKQKIDGVYDDHFTIESNCFDWDYRAIETFKFKKDDIQFGDIITTRNGERYVYADGHLYGEDATYYLDCEDYEDIFNDKLTYCDKSEEEYDIIKIERNEEVIYERDEEVREMTLQQIIDELGYEVKIIKEEE